MYDLRHCFKIALASARMKQVDWARKHNLSEAGMSMLLSGKMKSRRLSEAIDLFIRREFKKLGLKMGRVGNSAEQLLG